ncbi:MAG TPA: DUF2127 domain-containing protein [Terracidiphilus sp.]|jgi:uncharacterized membrane protein (DUF2068 family)
MKSSHTEVLRLIALFKMLKAATLMATGIGAFKLIHGDAGRILEHWAAMVNLDPGGPLVNLAIQKVTNLSPHRIRELGIVSFIYAGLFLTEGVGLLLLKVWAEWFTIIITGSLVPVEFYELIHRLTAIKALILILNIAVVFYLIHHIRRRAPVRR